MSQERGQDQRLPTPGTSHGASNASCVLVAFGNTHPGLTRKDNQDALFYDLVEGFGTYAVIDGIGGYAGGDVAAQTARDQIRNRLGRLTASPLQLLKEAVTHANNSIFEKRDTDPMLSRMACVLTAVLVDPKKQRAYFAHVGDTRLYRYREGSLDKLTSDHSFVGLREDHGQLTEEEAMRHPRRNEILREVGADSHTLDDEDFIELGQADLIPGDHLLLCSDGLTDMVRQAEIAHLLHAHQHDPEGAVSALIHAALEGGGKDNVTVLVIRFTHQSETRPIPTEQPVSEENNLRCQTPRHPIAITPPVTTSVTEDVVAASSGQSVLPPQPPHPRKRRRWVVWALLGVAFLVLSIGVAYALFRDDLIDVPGIRSHDRGALEKSGQDDSAIAHSTQYQTLQSAIERSERGPDGFWYVRLDSNSSYLGPAELQRDSLVVLGTGAVLRLSGRSAGRVAIVVPDSVTHAEFHNLRIASSPADSLRAAISVQSPEVYMVLNGLELEQNDLTLFVVETDILHSVLTLRTRGASDIAPEAQRERGKTLGDETEPRGDR